MVEIALTVNARLEKLRRVMTGSRGRNPFDLPVMSSPPTISAVSTTSPAATLPVAVTLITTPSVINHFGGVSSSNGTALQVLSVTRNDASRFGYSGYVEVATDAPIIGFGFLTPTIAFLVEVDGVLASQTPTTGAGGGTLYFTLDFASRKVRRIRVHCSSAVRFIYRTQADKAWAPSTDDVIRMAVTGDSLTATTGASQVCLGWVAHAAATLGFRDPRAIGIGGTGYVTPGAGTAWKCRDHISDVTSITPDLIVFAHGANDGSVSAQVQAEALLNYQAVRATTSAPIVVLGPWPLETGPAANTLAVEAAVSAAVAQFNDPYCKFVPVSADPTGAWINGTGRTGAPTGIGNSDIYNGGTDGTDTAHPNDLGHKYLGLRAAEGIRAAILSMIA